MSQRSGVGLVELAILEALAGPGRGYKTNARALRHVEDHIGLAPDYAYQVLVDLALPWAVPVVLIEGQGNYGSRGNDPPAHFQYTESRLSAAGRTVLSAERGDLAPVPVGLINGSTHRSGTRPPFRPQAVIDAIRQVIEHPKVTSQEIIDIIGPPDFLTGCTVSGDLAALAAARPADLRLAATVTVSDDRQSVVIENIPPNISIDDVTASIASRARLSQRARQHPRLLHAAGLDLHDVRDDSDDRHVYGRILCKPTPGTPPELLRDQLTRIHGVYTTVRVDLPRPLPAMIRQWVRAHHTEDLPASLAALGTAIRNQPDPAH